MNEALFPSLALSFAIIQAEYSRQSIPVHVAKPTSSPFVVKIFLLQVGRWVTHITKIFPHDYSSMSFSGGSGMLLGYSFVRFSVLILHLIPDKNFRIAASTHGIGYKLFLFASSKACFSSIFSPGDPFGFFAWMSIRYLLINVILSAIIYLVNTPGLHQKSHPGAGQGYALRIYSNRIALSFDISQVVSYSLSHT
jgi:hypothetical protein